MLHIFCINAKQAEYYIICSAHNFVMTCTLDFNWNQSTWYDLLLWHQLIHLTRLTELTKAKLDFFSFAVGKSVQPLFWIRSMWIKTFDGVFWINWRIIWHDLAMICLQSIEKSPKRKQYNGLKYVDLIIRLSSFFSTALYWIKYWVKFKLDVELFTRFGKFIVCQLEQKSRHTVSFPKIAIDTRKKWPKIDFTSDETQNLQNRRICVKWRWSISKCRKILLKTKWNQKVYMVHKTTKNMYQAQASIKSVVLFLFTIG